ncbi:MAG TPA: hypothetical protein DEP28_00990 [Bacteroidetes bacterium]|nr:hypothetical protein [Ignavibacteria bacterium]HCA41808.1 hypothetical protein [Bacteroidota bacterium]HCN37524.1 hypothetical protein [Bacteroidota bacterium]
MEPNTQIKDPNLVRQMQFVVISRKAKVLGFAIMLGLVIIYLMGLTVASDNVNKDLAILNLVSLIACSTFCILSVYVKKMFLRKVTKENFKSSYFTAFIIAYAMCDAGGLFCIVTNLFINYNFLYATVGLLISMLYLFINLPKPDEFENLKLY